MKTIRLMITAAVATTVFATVASAETPIKIGVMADLSSVYSAIGGPGEIEAARMAAEDFGGSVLGRPIEIVPGDALNKSDNAVAMVRQWFDGGVDMVADIPTSGTALAVIPVATEKHKIIMISGGGTSDITGKACSPYVAHWNWDTYAMAHSTGASVLKAGGDKWFFITADYVFGATLQADTTAVVTKGGGSVVGSAKHPLGTTDFSSQLLQAASSGANVIGVANAGGDTINSIKQAHEFHVPQKLAALVAFVSDIHSIGLETAQGTLLTEAFYWDQDEQSRAFSKRFFARARQMPTSVQAGTYSAITHWLQAVKAVGSTDSDAVMAQMRKTPVEDFATHGAMLRADGRLMRDMYLFQVKTPAESKGEWDLYKVVSKVPAEQAFRPMSEGGCKLLQ
jgi:branched-chain amino acid transport system substrate-binding protein